MRATIKDIAREAGVSITTVSLVLNGKSYKIPDQTKKLVFDTARELNYVPNQLAVGLVKKRSQTIGLIVPDISNTYFATMARGIDEMCREYGSALILCNSGDQHEHDLEYITRLAGQGVDGLIFVMASDSDDRATEESLKLLKDLKLPFVLMDRFITKNACPSIIVDHIKGGELVTKHLLDLGHRRIACVVGPEYLADARQRREGYVNEMKKAGVPVNPDLIIHGDYSKEGGYQAAKLLLERDVTAIFACNDMSALGVMQYLEEQQVRVPEDVSVVGYDDIMFASFLKVPLTTIRQPIYEMGVEAVKELMHQINEEIYKNESIVFTPTLIVRESTARCRRYESDGKKERSLRL